MVYNHTKQGIHVPPAEEAVLTTLAYSDIFSFPLTKKELWHFLIAKEVISRKAFDNCFPMLKKYISNKNGYFCLKNHEEIIMHRMATLPEVTRKLQRARLIAGKLSLLSSVLFIGITGGLAVGNVTKRDDIDFVIITKKNTLFITRFLILVLLQILGVRRSRKQKNTADTICVNLLFDESALRWFADKNDIYTAKEIAQILPLFDRKGIYQRFMSANTWIQNFLPNSGYTAFDPVKVPNSFLTRVLDSFTNVFYESFSRFLQMSWMSRHQTSETLSKHVLAFHPVDYRVKTLTQLRLKLHQLGLLTKF